LLARVAERDEDALGELYERFAPGLLGILLRILSDHGAAEDLLRGLFQRLWEQARLLRQEGASVAAWLSMAARAHAIDRRRAELKLPERRLAASLEAFPSWLPRPEEIALFSERRELLKKVLNQLPKPQRQALELAVFDGLTETEIAEKSGEPQGKARAGLRAAMSFLRHRVRAVLGTWSVDI
jgi:RNA polymerase sigma-70 factor (ECF subfamily)